MNPNPLHSDLGIILLAAGSSSRMGQSKQLLKVNGNSLLYQSAKAVADCEATITLVVLGDNALNHKLTINTLPVEVAENEVWHKGIGNSLKFGLSYLLKKKPQLKAVLVCVCDQPLLSTEHLQNIISTAKNCEESIVASYYSTTAGVPGLFKSIFFDQLLSIQDQDGAKSIVQKNLNKVKTVDFPGGEIDLDTWSDYETFLKKNL